MEIWCCYTTCDSVIAIDGYATSKKEALGWMEITLDIAIPETGFEKPTMKDKYNYGSGYRIEVDRCHDIIIEKLKRVFK